MLRFLTRRVLSGLALLVVIATLAFLLLYLGAGDVGRRILGPTASAETVALKNQQLGLDEPLLTRFGDWAIHALQGDLGTSWFSGASVTTLLVTRIGVTLSLVIGAILLSALVSVLLGVWAAVGAGVIDRVVQVIAVLGFAIPGFLVALGLVNLFALQLKWFRPTGYVPLTTSFGGWLGSITLPVIALAIGVIATVALQVRSSVVDALGQEWVRTLRSRGLSERRIVYRYVLRTAAGPALAVLAVQFIALIGGAVIVEQVFAIPGLGQVSVTATSQGDVPLVMGLVLAVSIIVLIVNLVIDIVQGWLNPKVRVA